MLIPSRATAAPVLLSIPESQATSFTRTARGRDQQPAWRERASCMHTTLHTLVTAPCWIRRRTWYPRPSQAHNCWGSEINVKLQAHNWWGSEINVKLQHNWWGSEINVKLQAHNWWGSELRCEITSNTFLQTISSPSIITRGRLDVKFSIFVDVDSSG